MISVIETYNAVRDLCNKDQKGFVTPEVFNSFASIAQQNIFNEMYQELIVAKKLQRGVGDPGRDKSPYKLVEEALAYFIQQVNLKAYTPPLNNPSIEGALSIYTFTDASVFDKPKNLGHIISMRDSTDFTSLELVYNSETAERILQSNLSSPTSDFPVAIISRNIEVLPSDVNSVILKYYRTPSSLYTVTIGDDTRGDIDYSSTPTFTALSSTDGLVIPSLQGCRDFELAHTFKTEIVYEIAKLIGIRLRDTFLTSIASTEEKEE